VALPPAVRQDDLWTGYFGRQHTGSRRVLAERIFANAGVRTRQAAVSPLLEDVSDWSTERRMRRYQVEAMPLGKGGGEPGAPPTRAWRPTRSACSRSARAPGTRRRGWTSCSPVTWAWRRRCGGCSSGTWAVTRRCRAWVPAADFVLAQGRPALLLCAELTSLHLQPPASRADIQQIVSHALFSDRRGRRRAHSRRQGILGTPSVRSPRSRTADRRPHDVGGHRLWASGWACRRGCPTCSPCTSGGSSVDLLARHGLKIADVDGWAIHPGGPKILDVVQEQLGLDEAALAPSLDVLAAYGNCSSPTVLMVLDALRRPRGAPAPHSAARLRPGTHPLRISARGLYSHSVMGDRARGVALYATAAVLLAGGAAWWIRAAPGEEIDPMIEQWRLSAERLLPDA
jgi:predicted naringenin-chalcone synthase